MASIVLTVPDPDVPRIVAAYEAAFGPKQSGETDSDFIKRVLAARTNALILEGEVKIASDQATADFVPVPVT